MWKQVIKELLLIAMIGFITCDNLTIHTVDIPLSSSPISPTVDEPNTLLGNDDVILVLSPGKMEGLVENHQRDVLVNYTFVTNAKHSIYNMQIDVAKPQGPDIVMVMGNTSFLLENMPFGSNMSVSFTLRGLFLGRTRLSLNLQPVGLATSSSTDGYSIDNAPQQRQLAATYHVSVIRQIRALDTIFTIVIILLVCIAQIAMGCKVDLDDFKVIMKRPIAPIIGFCSQYGFMPVLAFGIAKLMKLDSNLALGFFVMGCAPGGGGSNLYTYLLDGDIGLSIAMTLISTVAALGMIPLWLFTLGRQFINNIDGLRIPFENIIGTLFLIVIPVTIGILIKRKKPVWAKKIEKITRPIFVILIIFIFTIGIYANLYIFKLFSWRIMIAGALLPYCGFILGGLLAFICRQPFDKIKTICIETGIQNTGIPILLMKVSLMQPDSDLSIVAPIASSCFTPIPLWIAVACYEIKKRCFDKKKDFEPVLNDEEINVLHNDETDISGKLEMNGEVTENNRELKPLS
ncbi:unnamed protein product [Owenia fusiformis]|uniref:Uncharacterized protein n=1 Tax=Owenia fusiformis TaxID=6347 RepID=A0A8J1UPF4_OWEFU|nr:unnamed protein product [Owenia fusiformis]